MLDNNTSLHHHVPCIHFQCVKTYTRRKHVCLQTYRNPPGSLDKYHLDDPPLNATERKIVDSYNKDTTFPRTVRDAVSKLQALENISEQARGQLKHCRTSQSGLEVSSNKTVGHLRAD